MVNENDLLLAMIPVTMLLGGVAAPLLGNSFTSGIGVGALISFTMILYGTILNPPYPPRPS